MSRNTFRFRRGAGPGNPAVVCVSEALFSPETMKAAALAVQSPMTAFVFPPALTGAEYDIRYFSPNGTRVDVCGHATMVAARAVAELCGVTGARYRLDPLFYPDGRVISGACPEGGPASIVLPMQPSARSGFAPSRLPGALSLRQEDVRDFHVSGIMDYIVFVENSAVLRALKPDFEKIIGLWRHEMPHRTIVATAPSAQAGLDYEARVFAPAIGVDEDIACGSVNGSLAAIWADICGKGALRMVYPSVPGGSLTTAGGYQDIEVRSGTVVISSHVRKAWSLSLSGPAAEDEEEIVRFARSSVRPLSRKSASSRPGPAEDGLIFSAGGS